MDLEEELKHLLKPEINRKVVLLGIGSTIRHDDAVGLRVIELLQGKQLRNTYLLNVETVPESYTGVIRDFSPTHVIMIDAAHFDGKPGEGRLIPTQSITNENVSTHNLPLTIFADFIRKSMCSHVVLVGIQPVDMSFGEGLTKEVEEGAQKIADTIYKILK
jgi:hydrogenase 3 maturation protease